MKKISFACAALLMLTGSVVAKAQSTQVIPDKVTTVSLSDRQSLRVVEGETTSIQADSKDNPVAVVRGNAIYLNCDDDVTLNVAPGRHLFFNTEDYANVVFDGSFSDLNIDINARDYSSIEFKGNDGDTVRCSNLSIDTRDFSRALSKVVFNVEYPNLHSIDFSRIDINIGEYKDMTVRIDDYGRVNIGDSTELNSALNFVYNMTDRLVDYSNKTSKAESKRKKSHSWRSGDFDFDFAWGWHNWGRSTFGAFESLNSASEVATSFNNIFFGGNVMLIGTDWMGVYAGLGLEWDKWKFNNPDVVFSTSTDPYSFVAGNTMASQTTLTTRYVEVPISIRFGNVNKLWVAISAIPGIHWDASGLRHKNTVDNTTIKSKDRSINSYINPYKFDIRTAIHYGQLGVYVQFSTVSTFRNNTEELFPIKFGLII